MIKKINGKRGLAISQIFILIIGIIAFSYIVGSEFRIVSSFGGGASGVIVEDDCTTWFDYGTNIKRYTVTGSDTISRVGTNYKKISNDWKYYSERDNEYKSVGEPAFDSLANEAIMLYDECMEGLNNGEEIDNSGISCEKDCILNKAYDKGGCKLPNSCIGNVLNLGRHDGCAPRLVCCCENQINQPTDDVSTTQIPIDAGLAIAGTVTDFIPKGDGEDPDIEINDKDIPDPDDGPAKIPFGWGKKNAKVGYLFGGIVQGLIAAVAVVGAIQMIKAFFPERKDNLFNALSVALGVGTAVGGFAKGIVTSATGGVSKGIGSAIGFGAVTAVILFFAVYKKKSQEIITFTCYPWEAPTGGDDCEKCNEQGILSCSEYQCRSLGQACELINKGTDKEQCVWMNRNDVDFPTIEPSEDALLNNYEYEIQNTGISPPDTGVIIEYTEAQPSQCVPAFTPLSFGITLSEPAKCKLDILRKESYDEMNYYFSGGLSLYNHSYALSLPGSSALESEGIEIENDGDYEVYVRCQDANGNSNTANFVFKFCVEKGPDTTPPLIIETNPLNNMPFAYNQTSIDTIVYVNEPVEGCKWSHLDQSYDDMEDDIVHQMDCDNADNLIDMDAQGLYSCATTLTGLKDRQDNKFYFRCKDQAENANRESYEYTLIGTQPLVIDWVTPESGSIIKDSTDAVKVTLEAKTSAGYNEGEANCYYSNTGDTEDYVMFFNTGSYQHSQDLWLAEESHEYFIKCIDLGGNTDSEVINFEVDSDASTPIVVRAYHEETYLKLITNEPARCVYDTKYEDYPCDYAFDDGTPMTTLEDVNHYTTWNTELTFYIICQDEYGNQPDPDECSMIVRPSEIY